MGGLFVGSLAASVAIGTGVAVGVIMGGLCVSSLAGVGNGLSVGVRVEVTARVGVTGEVPVVGITVEPWDDGGKPTPNSRHVRPIANNTTAHNEAPRNSAALIEGL